MKRTPQRNTLLNYFTSPKVDKSKESPTVTKAVTPTTPKSRSQPNKKEEKQPLKKTQESSASVTPKRKRDETKKPLKGKENKKVPKKQESVESAEDEDEEIKPQNKKRRVAIPDSDSDSGEEFVPDESVESEDENMSLVISSEDPESESDSDESPKKKSKPSRKPAQAKTKISAKSELKLPSEGTTKKVVDSNSWVHLTFDFLKPENIRDKNRRRPNDPNYDPKTLFLSPGFLDQQTPAMRQWWVLKSDHFDCILFFKVGKFYELFHMDAVIGVQELNLSYMKGEHAHVGFPEIAYGRFSSSLVEKGYKVARIEQTENPEMAKERVHKTKKATKFDKVVRREICQISTIGTMVQSVQDAETATPNSKFLLALVEKSGNDKKDGSTFGVCFVDTTIGDFYLGQFTDDRANSRLLTLFAHYPPIHVIFEKGNLSSETKKVLETFLPSAIKEAMSKDSEFWSACKVLEKLKEDEYFMKNGKFVWPEDLVPFQNPGDTLGITPNCEKELAVHALGGCVSLLRSFLLDQQLLAQARFKTYVPPDFSGTSGESTLPSSMVLDSVTMSNLKIAQGPNNLIQQLDRCCTAFGKRLLRDWVCRPSCKKSVILQRQGAIAELVERPEIAKKARELLSTLPDLERLLSKIHTHGNAAKMNDHPDGRAFFFDAKIYSKRRIVDFVNALNGFTKTQEIVEIFKDMENELISRCSQIEPNGTFPSLEETLKHFKNAFDHEEAKKEGSILPKGKGLDEEYDAVIEELENLKVAQAKYLEKQKKHFGVNIKFFGIDRKRFQIEVPDSQLSKVGPGYELQNQRKGFKRYWTEEAKTLLANQTAAEAQKDKVLKDLNRRMFAKFSEKYEMWNRAVFNVATLDVLLSLAEYARERDVCIPEILDDTENQEPAIEIVEGKHPCINNENFIPNDTMIGTNDAAKIIILTGPNMGGKSTLMRQVGLLTVMAQIGSHVPAESCRVTLADRIFTRLGANDDIMAGQSTFLVELTETASILQHATKFSLILLDELGRGTSTYDGTAIAAAVLNELKKIDCRTLFSTHYHSLVEDYKNDREVSLAHMACMVEKEFEDEDPEMSEERVTFLYKLSQGACPKSYGFNAARLAGIPMEIIKRARKVADELENEVKRRHEFFALCKSIKFTN